MRQYNWSASTSGLAIITPPTPISKFGANLVGWWKADAGLTSLGTPLRVSALADQSASGANLLQATVANQLLYVASAKNSLPGFYNDGTIGTTQRNLVGAHSAALSFDYNMPFSVAVTFICGSTRAAFEWLLGQMLPSGAFTGWHVDTGTRVTQAQPGLSLCTTFNSAELFVVENVGALVAGTTYSYVLTYDGSSTAAGIKIYRNGAASTTLTAKNALPASTTIVSASNVPFTMGINGTTGTGHTFLEGYIVNRVITAAEAAVMDQYSNLRYAIH